MKNNNMAYQLQIPKELHTEMLHVKADTGVSLQSQIISALRYRFDIPGEGEKAPMKCAQCDNKLLFEKTDQGFDYNKVEPCKRCQYKE